MKYTIEKYYVLGFVLAFVFTNTGMAQCHYCHKLGCDGFICRQGSDSTGRSDAGGGVGRANRRMQNAEALYRMAQALKDARIGQPRPQNPLSPTNSGIPGINIPPRDLNETNRNNSISGIQADPSLLNPSPRNTSDQLGRQINNLEVDPTLLSSSNAASSNVDEQIRQNQIEEIKVSDNADAFVDENLARYVAVVRYRDQAVRLLAESGPDAWKAVGGNMADEFGPYFASGLLSEAIPLNESLKIAMENDCSELQRLARQYGSSPGGTPATQSEPEIVKDERVAAQYVKSIGENAVRDMVAKQFLKSQGWKADYTLDLATIEKARVGASDRQTLIELERRGIKPDSLPTPKDIRGLLVTRSEVARISDKAANLLSNQKK